MTDTLDIDKLLDELLLGVDKEKGPTIKYCIPVADIAGWENGKPKYEVKLHCDEIEAPVQTKQLQVKARGI